MERRRTDACAPTGETADQHLRAPKGRRRAQRTAKRLSLIQHIQRLYLFLYMFMLSNFHTELGFSVRCAR